LPPPPSGVSSNPEAAATVRGGVGGELGVSVPPAAAVSSVSSARVWGGSAISLGGRLGGRSGGKSGGRSSGRSSGRSGGGSGGRSGGRLGGEFGGRCRRLPPSSSLRAWRVQSSAPCRPGASCAVASKAPRERKCHRSVDEKPSCPRCESK